MSVVAGLAAAFHQDLVAEAELDEMAGLVLGQGPGRAPVLVVVPSLLAVEHCELGTS
jgi:hypothetical protein